MASIRFNLRKTNSENPTPINAVIRWDGMRLVYSTQESIHPKQWNTDRQRAKETPDTRSLNMRLESLRAIALEELRNFKIQNEVSPTKSQLKDQLDLRLKRNSIEDSSFMGFVKSFAERSTERINETTGKPLAITTIRNYKRIAALLEEYMMKHGRIEFEEVDQAFYQSFIRFLTQEKQFSTNTIGKHIKSLKSILNEATELGINSTFAYKSKRFRAIQEEVDTVYLNRAELEELANIDLSHSEALANARDLFLVGCYTGLRYSDFSRLDRSNINDGFIRIRAQKTEKEVWIPVLPQLQRILDRYENENRKGLPRKIANPKLNRYIKEICQMCPGLHQSVEITFTKAGSKHKETRQKWELVQTHTARRSFASNAFELGVNSRSIMAITGHRTEKAFLKYIRLSEKQHAQMLKDTWTGNSTGHLKAV